ncbi:MAG TPA: hypothetical protein VKI18_11630 [Albitalea sp.]|nr:hypothetical protein [Albitalea sp.]
MLVEVVCLRRAGAKLPPEELRAATPVRRLLTIDTVPVRRYGSQSDLAPSVVARLWRCEFSGTDEPADDLECAHVSRVGGDGLLVVGVESRGSASAHAQAWWCRLILDSEPTQAAPA